MDGWQPSATPPIGVELTDEQKLACAFRILAHDGFSENMAGHHHVGGPRRRQPPHQPVGTVVGGGLRLGRLPCRCERCCGRREVGRHARVPHPHELHRRRPDARVVIHNHPYYVTLLAAVGVLPMIAHQTGSLYDDDLSLVSEYTGEVDDAALGRDLADKIGDRNNVILASHGIITTADTIELAVYRAASIDRFCRLAYDILLLGKDPLPIEKRIRVAMQKALVERAAGVYWAGAVRKLIRTHPDVLD